MIQDPKRYTAKHLLRIPTYTQLHRLINRLSKKGNQNMYMDLYVDAKFLTLGISR